jgi:acetyltransferase
MHSWLPYFNSINYEGIELGIENLNRFFNPHSIAVVGASDREGSIGARILRNLTESYKGLIFPVNPFRPAVQGIKAWPSVERIPSKVDLSIVATPAHTIPQIIEECGKAGIPNVIIVSSGFDEKDESGKKLIQQISELKKIYGMRIIGPSSLGVIRPKTNLYATFAEKKAIPGKIAFVSQSAALCGSVLDWSCQSKVGLSAVVSTGLAFDVDLSELIDYFGSDPQTRTIMLYVESIKDIRSFMSAARGFARSKPIILVKAGRFVETAESKLSDDSRIASNDAIYDAVFRRIGIVRVDSVDELFNCANGLSAQPRPGDNSLAIVTNADGPGLLAVDQLITKEGKLAELSKESAEKLRSILPYYCSFGNPIDILEEADPQRFRKVIQLCLTDPGIKNILAIFTPFGRTSPSEIANLLIESAKQTRKTVLVSIMGEDDSCQDARRTLNYQGIPAFRTPEEAVRTFIYMNNYIQNLNLLYQTPEELTLNLEIPTQLKALIRRAFCEGRNVLNLNESFSFIQSYKIETIKSEVARTIEEARRFACEMGYPVTLKPLLTRARSRKEKDQNTLEICSPKEIQEKFGLIAEESRKLNSPEDFQEIVVQPKNRHREIKILLNSRKDTKFGVVITLGTDNPSTNINSQLSVGFPPLNQILARQIIEGAKIEQLIKEYENSTVLTPLLEEILLKFSQLVTDFPEFIEINLLIVITERTVYVDDASIVIDRDRIMREIAHHHDHLVIAPYPKKYITKRTLKNGAQVKLRPVKPEDEKRFNDLFKSLSEETVRFRFFETIKEMSHDTLTRYCNLDYDREIAMVAELQDDKRIIGVVRLTADVGGKNGEFAVLVGDSWQGLGLGSKLMDVIVEIAKDLKVETIYSFVTRANSKMIRMCIGKGFEIKPVDEYTISIFKNLLI